jgi:hypothetical protein
VSVGLGENFARKMPTGTPALLGIASIICLLVVSGFGLRRPASPVDRVARFQISFPSSLRAAPITGRVYLILSKSNDAEPRFQAGDWDNVVVPMFGVDVSALQPGTAATIDAGTRGIPMRSLRELPAGDYYAQAVLNIYTECHRADGHDVWVHLDQGEGQQFNSAPGNLISDVTKVHLDAAAGFDGALSLSKIIPPIAPAMDSTWVKHVKLRSALLTKFWGCPIDLGASVLLPKGYDAHPGVAYPVVYLQSHFSADAPFGFDPDAKVTHPTWAEKQAAKKGLNVIEPVRPLQIVSGALVQQETPREFYEAWNSDDFPRVIAVTFQHPTPYFDDSYAVNSANNGPYGDALLQELIPALEKQFRMIPESYARVLTGGSTGGWESLALQVYHPDFFGGTWTFYPDPVDFRSWGSVNIYEDKNFFVQSDEFPRAPYYMQRVSDGRPRLTNQQFNDIELVLGSHGRSAEQFGAWDAAYGPVGEDGYPKPLWNLDTGEMDRSVAEYMRAHDYDLRDYLQRNWAKIGPNLVGKLHLFSGDMDNYYLNLGVYKLEDFLVNARDPEFGGSFTYGRPMKGHGWQPTTNAELIRTMAGHMAAHAPKNKDSAAWHYK